MLDELLLSKWREDIEGTVSEFPLDGDYPTWTFRASGRHGVIIPYGGKTVINEKFAGAEIRSVEKLTLADGRSCPALILSSDHSNSSRSFVTLCSDFINPGVDGTIRRKIETDPLEWWLSWKELVGNRNITEKVYDVLGELCVLKKLTELDKSPEWHGPCGGTYDIETETGFVEVKSTNNKTGSLFSVNSALQMKQPGKPLSLIFCRFESSTHTGTSIDSIVEELTSLGFQENDLEYALELKGLEKGMSARKKTYILHEMLEYKVDDTFPRITDRKSVV